MSETSNKILSGEISSGEAANIVEDLDNEIDNLRAALSAMTKDRDKVKNALKEIVAITDRKHKVWDDAHAAMSECLDPELHEVRPCDCKKEIK